MELHFKAGTSDFEKDLVRQALKIESDLIKMLRKVGEEFVSDARQNLNITGAFPKGKYKDRTANLRSSIGYCIFNNGKIVDSNLEGTNIGVNEAEGIIAENSPDEGLHLFLVAGMDYASYVESMGYNVITSQAGMAVVNLESVVKKYNENPKIIEMFEKFNNR